MKDIEIGAEEQDGQSAGNSKEENGGRARIERQIEALLTAEEDVTVLHNRLFSQGGLFHQLAPTREARHKQKDSPLYRRAKAVVNKMMLDAEADIRKSISQATSR